MDNIILAPKDKIYDLVSLSDFIDQSLISMFMFKNPSIMYGFGIKEDYAKEGFFVRDKNNAKIILGREYNPCIYRGENKDYGGFVPSYSREKYTKNKELHCIEYIKREEFKIIFKETPYYKIISKLQIMGYNFEFDLDAIAQHYNFATNYIDVTKDIKIALFFAYTDYDASSGKYFPVEDFSIYKPTLYVSNFALLEMTNVLNTVGFQAVLRPQVQYAMAIDVKNNTGTSNFRKIELTQNADIAYGLYNSFHNGEDLFPDEPVTRLQQIVRNRKSLNMALFCRYCDLYKKDSNDLLKILSDKYSIDSSLPSFDTDLKNKMQTDTVEKLIPWIVKNISYRRIKRPKENEKEYFIDALAQSIPDIILNV